MDSMWLRPLRDKGEFGVVLGWLHRPENARWLDVAEEALPAAKAWVASKSRGDVVFVFGPPACDVPVGAVGIHHRDQRNGTAEIWAVVGIKEYCCRGMALCGLNTAVDFAFSQLGLESVMVWTLPDNAAGTGLARRAGFTFVGRRRRCHRTGAGVCDRLLFDMSRDEWERKGVSDGAVHILD